MCSTPNLLQPVSSDTYDTVCKLCVAYAGEVSVRKEFKLLGLSSTRVPEVALLLRDEFKIETLNVRPHTFFEVSQMQELLRLAQNGIRGIRIRYIQDA